LSYTRPGKGPQSLAGRLRKAGAPDAMGAAARQVVD